MCCRHVVVAMKFHILLLPYSTLIRIMRHCCTSRVSPLPNFFPPYECYTYLLFGPNLPYFSLTLNVILHTQIRGYQWWLLLIMGVQEDKHSSSGPDNDVLTSSPDQGFAISTLSSAIVDRRSHRPTPSSPSMHLPRPPSRSRRRRWPNLLFRQQHWSQCHCYISVGYSEFKNILSCLRLSSMRCFYSNKKEHTLPSYSRWHVMVPWNVMTVHISEKCFFCYTHVNLNMAELLATEKKS